MSKQSNRWGLHAMSLARRDWPFGFGIVIAAAFVGSVLVVMPEWRETILGAFAITCLVLLAVERARARRRMHRLATQLDAVASLEKLEVSTDPSIAMLDQALNNAIQRTREQARIVQMSRQTLPIGEALRFLDEDNEATRSVAVLALGLRDHHQVPVSAEMMIQLRQIAGTVVGVAERGSALLQMQGSGTFALIFAAFSQEPAARSAKAALAAAVELAHIYPELHFGLSSGTGLSCRLPGAGYTVIGAPLEEAIRLHRLAASWHEYRILCPEPVALLVRPHTPSQRTPLQLTFPHAPPLPVYSLEITPEAIALGA